MQQLQFCCFYWQLSDIKYTQRGRCIFSGLLRVSLAQLICSVRFFLAKRWALASSLIKTTPMTPDTLTWPEGPPCNRNVFNFPFLVSTFGPKLHFKLFVIFFPLVQHGNRGKWQVEKRKVFEQTAANRWSGHANTGFCVSSSQQ